MAGYEIFAGGRREPSAGVMGLEPGVTGENEKSADNEGEWETLGVLYALLN